MAKELAFGVDEHTGLDHLEPVRHPGARHAYKSLRSGPDSGGLYVERDCWSSRFAHTNQLRSDRALHALLGMKRFPSDDTILNY
jgi:hypothetical protein